jgi:phenylacetate-CoA ligase
MDEADRAALAGQLAQAVKAHIGVSAAVRVLECGQVERTLTGKARRVVDKRPR